MHPKKDTDFLLALKGLEQKDPQDWVRSVLRVKNTPWGNYDIDLAIRQTFNKKAGEKTQPSLYGKNMNAWFPVGEQDADSKYSQKSTAFLSACLTGGKNGINLQWKITMKIIFQPDGTTELVPMHSLKENCRHGPELFYAHEW